MINYMIINYYKNFNSYQFLSPLLLYTVLLLLLFFFWLYSSRGEL